MLLPIVFVLFSTLLNVGYRVSTGLSLTRSRQGIIVATHAFTTEIIQILLLLCGIAVAYSLIAAHQRHETIASFGFSTPTWIAVPTTLAIYVLSIFAIDAIDNKIQLGRWRHPIQIQTLLLTRSKLLPCTVKRRRRVRAIPKSPMRKRAMSEPLTPTMLRRAKLEAQRRDSIPVPGAVAKLVEAFEKDIFKEVPRLNEPLNDEASPEKVLIDEHQSIDTFRLSEAHGNAEELELSSSMLTPEATPERPSLPLEVTAFDQPKSRSTNTKLSKRVKREDKKAARHTGERIQRRREKGRIEGHE